MSTDIEPTRPADAEVLDLDTTSIGEHADFAEVITELGALARSQEEPVVLLAGKFAMYPMEDGGIMFVSDCPVGLIGELGVKRMRIPPAMLRAVVILAGGGSRASAIKAALFGGKRPKAALGDGR